MKHKLLADIGNTHFHIYDGNKIIHISHDEAIQTYQNTALYYICVKPSLLAEIAQNSLWINIAPKLKLEGSYSSMGIDRQALCLSRHSGIFIDAGSAITVDMVEQGVYQGGYILLGLKASIEAYAQISPVLETTIKPNLSLDTLPKSTKEGISYGIIAPIKALIETQSTSSKPLYFTGGDGAFLASFFEDAIYDEMLVFEGMESLTMF